MDFVKHDKLFWLLIWLWLYWLRHGKWLIDFIWRLLLRWIWNLLQKLLRRRSLLLKLLWLMGLIKLINIRELLCYDRIHWLQSGRLLNWSLKFGVLNIGFTITSKVKILYASKLLLALTSYCKKGMIVFFYPFDLFKSPFIVLLDCDGF